jgi:hypothetical protein
MCKDVMKGVLRFFNRRTRVSKWNHPSLSVFAGSLLVFGITAFMPGDDNDAAWFEFQPAVDDFGPTILDCSEFIEAPAGRHGFVTVKGDDFVFEDGTPVRFWGSQTGSRRDDPEYSAKRMRRQGINLIRQHGNLSRPGQLDAMIARLGEQGIYMAIDLYYPDFLIWEHHLSSWKPWWEQWKFKTPTAAA